MMAEQTWFLVSEIFVLHTKNVLMQIYTGNILYTISKCLGA